MMMLKKFANYFEVCLKQFCNIVQLYVRGKKKRKYGKEHMPRVPHADDDLLWNLVIIGEYVEYSKIYTLGLVTL